MIGILLPEFSSIYFSTFDILYRQNNKAIHFHLDTLFGFIYKYICGNFTFVVKIFICFYVNAIQNFNWISRFYSSGSHSFALTRAIHQSGPYPKCGEVPLSQWFQSIDVTTYIDLYVVIVIQASCLKHECSNSTLQGTISYVRQTWECKCENSVGSAQKRANKEDHRLLTKKNTGASAG